MGEDLTELEEAENLLWDSIVSGRAKAIVPAMENYVDVRIAIALERLYDDIEAKVGIRP